MQTIRAIAITVLLLILGLAVRPFPVAASEPFCAVGQEPQFGLGFADLKFRLGDRMGEPLECEHTDPTNGDALQTTTTGLAFYRSSTNVPMFTDGWKHWALTSYGLMFWEGTSVDPPGDLFPVGGVSTATSAGGPTLSPKQLVARNEDAILRVVVPEGCASALLVTADGYAVTNEHVVTSNSSIEVWLRDGRQMLVPVLATDEENDLALFKLPGAGYASVIFGRSADLALGSEVALLGHPVTLERATTGCSTEPTVSTGILSSRVSQFGLGWLQTDASMNPGVSGGGAFNFAAALVGIPTWVLIQSFAENVGYLIPSDRAIPIVDNWIKAHRAGVLPTPPAATAVAVRERGAVRAWELVTGQVAGSEVERWTYDGVAGELVIVDAWAIDTFLRFYGPDGTLLDEDDDSGPTFLSSRIRYLLGTSGTYSIEVSAVGGDQGDYSLAVLPPETRHRGPVELDQKVNAAIGQGGVDLWTFGGETGQAISIDARGFDTRLRVYGPDGRFLHENNDGLPEFGSRISILPMLAGAYTIEVTGVFGDSGGYELLLAATLMRDRGTISGPGDEVKGTVAGGEVELWEFQGREGFHVRLETWGFDTVLALYGPDMQLLAEDDNSAAGAGSFVRQLLQETGTYRVVISGLGDQDGDYTLVYTGAGAGLPPVISPGI